MLTDEELQANGGLEGDDGDMDDFDLDMEDVKNAKMDDIVDKTNSETWQQSEQEVKERVSQTLREEQEEKAAAEQRLLEEQEAAAAAKAKARGGVNQVIADSLLSSSYYNLTQPKDSEKPWVSQKPYQTPPFYPQQQHPSLSSPETFSQLESDTLFFAFYYQQQTYQQYLAARQLKMSSWRYHKKQTSWFQRFDTPVEAKDEYEKGTYVYFDYDKDWTQKKKTDFKFDYAYLEDELQVPVSAARAQAHAQAQAAAQAQAQAQQRQQENETAADTKKSPDDSPTE